jgi:hypothetical protein
VAALRSSHEVWVHVLCSLVVGCEAAAARCTIERRWFKLIVRRRGRVCLSWMGGLQVEGARHQGASLS